MHRVAHLVGEGGKAVVIVPIVQQQIGMHVSHVLGKRAAVVLNAAPVRGGMAEDARAAIAEHLEVAPVVLCQRSAYANAWIDGRSVEEYEPDGKAAAEIRALYRWLIQRLIF